MKLRSVIPGREYQHEPDSVVTVAADSELQIDYEHYYSEEDENNSLSEIESIEYDDEEEEVQGNGEDETALVKSTDDCDEVDKKSEIKPACNAGIFADHLIASIKKSQL